MAGIQLKKGETTLPLNEDGMFSILSSIRTRAAESLASNVRSRAAESYRFLGEVNYGIAQLRLGELTRLVGRIPFEELKRELGDLSDPTARKPTSATAMAFQASGGWEELRLKYKEIFQSLALARSNIESALRACTTDALRKELKGQSALLEKDSEQIRLKLFTAIGDREGVLNVLRESYERRFGDRPPFAAYYLHAKDNMEAARLLGQIVVLEVGLGKSEDYPKTIQLLRNAANQASDDLARIQSYAGLAAAYNSLGKLDDAMSCAVDARRIAEKSASLKNSRVLTETLRSELLTASLSPTIRLEKREIESAINKLPGSAAPGLRFLLTASRLQRGETDFARNAFEQMRLAPEYKEFLPAISQILSGLHVGRVNASWRVILDALSEGVRRSGSEYSAPLITGATGSAALAMAARGNPWAMGVGAGVGFMHGVANGHLLLMADSLVRRSGELVRSAWTGQTSITYEKHLENTLSVLPATMLSLLTIGSGVKMLGATGLKTLTTSIEEIGAKRAAAAGTLSFAAGGELAFPLTKQVIAEEFRHEAAREWLTALTKYSKGSLSFGGKRLAAGMLTFQAGSIAARYLSALDGSRPEHERQRMLAELQHDVLLNAYVIGLNAAATALGMGALKVKLPPTRPSFSPAPGQLAAPGVGDIPAQPGIIPEHVAAMTDGGSNDGPGATGHVGPPSPHPPGQVAAQAVFQGLKDPLKYGEDKLAIELRALGVYARLDLIATLLREDLPALLRLASYIAGSESRSLLNALLDGTVLDDMRVFGNRDRRSIAELERTLSVRSLTELSMENLSSVISLLGVYESPNRAEQDLFAAFRYAGRVLTMVRSIKGDSVDVIAEVGLRGLEELSPPARNPHTLRMLVDLIPNLNSPREISRVISYLDFLGVEALSYLSLRWKELSLDLSRRGISLPDRPETEANVVMDAESGVPLAQLTRIGGNHSLVRRGDIAGVLASIHNEIWGIHVRGAAQFDDLLTIARDTPYLMVAALTTQVGEKGVGRPTWITRTSKLLTHLGGTPGALPMLARKLTDSDPLSLISTLCQSADDLKNPITRELAREIATLANAGHGSAQSSKLGVFFNAMAAADAVDRVLVATSDAEFESSQKALESAFGKLKGLSENRGWRQESVSNDVIYLKSHLIQYMKSALRERVESHVELRLSAKSIREILRFIILEHPRNLGVEGAAFDLLGIQELASLFIEICHVNSKAADGFLAQLLTTNPKIESSVLSQGFFEIASEHLANLGALGRFGLNASENLTYREALKRMGFRWTEQPAEGSVALGSLVAIAREQKLSSQQVFDFVLDNNGWFRVARESDSALRRWRNISSKTRSILFQHLTPEQALLVVDQSRGDEALSRFFSEPLSASGDFSTLWEAFTKSIGSGGEYYKYDTAFRRLGQFTSVGNLFRLVNNAGATIASAEQRRAVGQRLLQVSETVEGIEKIVGRARSTDLRSRVARVLAQLATTQDYAQRTLLLESFNSNLVTVKKLTQSASQDSGSGTSALSRALHLINFDNLGR